MHPPQHIGNVAKVLNECREQAPKCMSFEAARHFNSIFLSITDVSAGVRNALRNYLFIGDPDPDDTLKDEYVQLVMDLAAGAPINEGMLSRHRARDGNSRGGKGIGATSFEPFWEACREVLLPDSAAEERRNSTNIYASSVHSIPNLVKQATDILEKKVVKGDLESLPAIPSDEWVRLQLVPNNGFHASTSKFTGRLGIKRSIQMRTLQKRHVDQHWVNALTWYYLEWMIEVRIVYGNGIEFFGQDDKAKVPIGDDVPVSTGVRANNNSITAVDDQAGLKAMDHDFHYSNLTPSVCLRSNIHKVNINGIY